MHFDIYDFASRRALFFARRAVSEFGGHSLKPEHLLLGLLEEKPEVVSSVLNPAASIERLIYQLRASVTEAERVFESVEVPFSEITQQVLRKSLDEAGGAEARVVRPEHLLLGLLGEGAGAAIILSAHGVSASEVRKRLRDADK
jgi:ATP-dependent Clp protease ATP-binding subunit ClpA